MLTISKPLSAGQAQTYHQKEFTAKEQNYWSQRGVIAGEWQGRLAGQFGLAGTVSAEEFAKLSQGQPPRTGEELVRQRASYEYQDAVGKTIRTMRHSPHPNLFRPRLRATRRNTSTHPVLAANRFVSTWNARAVRGRKLPRSLRTRR